MWAWLELPLTIAFTKCVAGCPGGAVSYANVSSYAGCKEVNGNLILTGAFLTK